MIDLGSNVKYSSEFVSRLGTGPERKELETLRGVVVEVKSYGNVRIAEIQWNDGTVAKSCVKYLTEVRQ